MFCARCWSLVGPHDRACPHCENDLTRPGSVRLADPRRVPRDSRGAPVLDGQTPTSAPPVKASFNSTGQLPQQPLAAPAVPLVAATGPGWWQGVKERLAETGEKAAAANKERREQQAAEPEAVEQPDTGQQVEPGPRIEVDQDRDLISFYQAVLPEPLSAPLKPAPTLAATAVKPDVKPAPPAVKPATAVQAPIRNHRPPRDLSLWDDYGMAEARTGLRIDREASPGQQIGQVMGASAVPAAKVTAFIAVVVGAMVVLALLVGRLVNMDASIPDPPPPVPTTASAPQTPELPADAQQCTDGLWASAQTECSLAIELGSQVPYNMTEPSVVRVHSASLGGVVRLDCVPGQGIDCRGLGDYDHVQFWLVV
ncbi:MAG: hypothetical protein ACOX61_11645 [Brooklawnia sp.]|jgi:hypothetical protein